MNTLRETTRESNAHAAHIRRLASRRRLLRWLRGAGLLCGVLIAVGGWVLLAHNRTPLASGLLCAIGLALFGYLATAPKDQH